ncbi:MAG: DinB family protein [Bacteroidetes bacterium]|nr:DinB family protein [Bacteroidota bacterium]
MTTAADIFQIGRNNVLNMLEGVTLEQLNKIPAGFTGNMAWHIGHLVSTQQGLLYRLSGNAVALEQSFVDKYKKGTFPQAPITQADLDFIKSELKQQPERLAADIKNNLFKTYTPYTTSFGNTIHSFDEALAFVNVHEGLHLGYLMALKRVVKNS